MKNVPVNTNDRIDREIAPLKAGLKDVNFILLGIVLVLLVAFVTLMVTVAQIASDSFRFNSVVYKEYSEKLDVIEELKMENRSISEQNRTNQETIIKQQQLILNKLPKN